DPRPFRDPERQPARGDCLGRGGARLRRDRIALGKCRCAEIGLGRIPGGLSHGASPRIVITREGGRSSIPVTVVINREALAYWMPPAGPSGPDRVAEHDSTPRLGKSARPQSPLERSIPEFPTKVGGHHMSGSTDPARDSSLKDR